MAGGSPYCSGTEEVIGNVGREGQESVCSTIRLRHNALHWMVFVLLRFSLPLCVKFGPFIKIKGLCKTLSQCDFGIMIDPIEVSSTTFALWRLRISFCEMISPRNKQHDDLLKPFDLLCWESALYFMSTKIS